MTRRIVLAVLALVAAVLGVVAVPLGVMAGGWALAHASPRTVILASGIACVAAGIGGYVGISRVPRSGRSMPRCDRYQMIARD